MWHLSISAEELTALIAEATAAARVLGLPGPRPDDSAGASDII